MAGHHHLRCTIVCAHIISAYSVFFGGRWSIIALTARKINILSAIMMRTLQCDVIFLNSKKLLSHFQPVCGYALNLAGRYNSRSAAWFRRFGGLVCIHSSMQISNAILRGRTMIEIGPWNTFAGICLDSVCCYLNRQSDGESSHTNPRS